MLDSDGSVHLETNGQTFWTLASDSCHLLANVLRLYGQVKQFKTLANLCEEDNQNIIRGTFSARASLTQAPND
jgi:hypothetical protein